MHVSVTDAAVYAAWKAYSNMGQYAGVKARMRAALEAYNAHVAALTPPPVSELVTKGFRVTRYDNSGDWLHTSAHLQKPNVRSTANTEIEELVTREQAEALIAAEIKRERDLAEKQISEVTDRMSDDYLVLKAKNAANTTQAEAREADLLRQLADMTKERNLFKAKDASKSKLLERFRSDLQEVCDGAEDEGDRAYFRSTNDLDTLRDIANKMDSWDWDKIIGDIKSDPYAELKELRAALEAAEAKYERWHKIAMDAGVIVHTDGTTSHPMRGRLEAAEAKLAAQGQEPVVELQYRPNEFDDWGMIRNADGSMFASVRRPASEEELAQHRANKTDPYEDLARRLIASYSPQPDRTSEAEYSYGDLVEKYTGEAIWHGTIVSAYLTTKGKLRYVVEVAPQGFQMIAVPSQLRRAAPEVE